MQQTNGVSTVISQEQSDLVSSATISAGGQDSIKNGKSVIINNNPVNINKTKITTLITSANNSKSSSNTTNINNNNSTTTNKNNSTNKSVPNGRTDVIVTNLQHKINSAAKNTTISHTASNQTSSEANGNGKTTATAPLPDVRAKQVLKEAVDAVVNSFTKHTQGYGRGEFINLNINLYFHRRGSG